MESESDFQSRLDLAEALAAQCGKKLVDAGAVVLTPGEHDSLQAYKMLYTALIYEVEKKYPDETRHESALRIIRQNQAGNTSEQARGKNGI